MSPDFIRDIYEHIHEESVRQQLEIMKTPSPLPLKGGE